MISTELLCAIIHFVVLLLFVALYFFVIMPCVTRTIKIPPRYDGNVPSGDISTVNGLGFSFFGDYRYDMKTQSYVTYEFLTLIIPLFPINCYRVKLLQDYNENHKTTIRRYHIYGTEKWHWFEVMSVYVGSFSGIAFFVIIINLLQFIF